MEDSGGLAQGAQEGGVLSGGAGAEAGVGGEEGAGGGAMTPPLERIKCLKTLK